jgi:hypothetical protein
MNNRIDEFVMKYLTDRKSKKIAQSLSSIKDFMNLDRLYDKAKKELKTIDDTLLDAFRQKEFELYKSLISHAIWAKEAEMKGDKVNAFALGVSSLKMRNKDNGKIWPMAEKYADSGKTPSDREISNLCIY